MPSTPTYCWSISINYYRLRSKTTLQVSKRLINKDFFYKINLIWLPITSTTISSRQSTDNERGQRWNANLIKSSPCSRSFFLSRGTVCWKAFLCSPRIQFIKQKKLQNVLADEEFHEHIRRWIVRTESFLQNPELASCARAARAAESWWRLEFLWKNLPIPLETSSVHSAFRCQLKQREGLSGGGETSFPFPFSEKHEESQTRNRAWKVTHGACAMDAGILFLMWIDLWKSVHAWWILIFIL